jgi:hypothetical protein
VQPILWGEEEECRRPIPGTGYDRRGVGDSRAQATHPAHKKVCFLCRFGGGRIVLINHTHPTGVVVSVNKYVLCKYIYVYVLYFKQRQRIGTTGLLEEHAKEFLMCGVRSTDGRQLVTRPFGWGRWSTPVVLGAGTGRGGCGDSGDFHRRLAPGTILIIRRTIFLPFSPRRRSFGGCLWRPIVERRSVLRFGPWGRLRERFYVWPLPCAFPFRS